MSRTDHSNAIKDLRSVAGIFDSLHEIDKHTGGDRYQKDALIARAAADLLEIHDDTGINLHEAPNLLAFVEGVAPALIGPVRVENNHA